MLFFLLIITYVCMFFSIVSLWWLEADYTFIFLVPKANVDNTTPMRRLRLRNSRLDVFLLYFVSKKQVLMTGNFIFKFILQVFLLQNFFLFHISTNRIFLNYNFKLLAALFILFPFLLSLPLSSLSFKNF